MRNRKIGRFAVTAIVGILSAISGYATAQYIKSRGNETEEKDDIEIITDHPVSRRKDTV